MLALIAALIFLLDLAGVRAGALDLTVLGLLFAALHLTFPIGLPARRG